MIGAIFEGIRRAVSAPRMLLLLWSVNFLVALPAAWAVAASLQGSMGESLVSERLAAGFDMAWYGEFQDGARGLESSFAPDLAGPGAFYANLETWITGALFDLPPAVLATGLAYLLLWVFLQGGIVARLARPRTGFRAGRFLGNAARYFFRFFRLFLMSGVAYILVFRLSWLAYDELGDALRDVPAERPALLSSLALLGLTAMVLAMIQAAFAYAKIATVIEDRRSMFVAMGSGIQVLLGRALRTAGVYAGFGIATVILLVIYGWLAPEAGPASTAGVILAFLLGQLFLLVRLSLRVSLLGGLVALHPADGTRSDALSRRL